MAPKRYEVRVHADAEKVSLPVYNDDPTKLLNAASLEEAFAMQALAKVEVQLTGPVTVYTLSHGQGEIVIYRPARPGERG